jgi:restriction endonuclease S subunit
MNIEKVGIYSDQIRGVSYKESDLHDSLNDQSVILLRANNIFENELNFDNVVYVDKSRVSQKQYIRRGDIVICASSGSKNLVGKAAQVDFDAKVTFGAFLKVIRPKNIVNEYLGYYFLSNEYRMKISSLSEGANINNIRNEHLDDLLISIVDKDTQNKRAEILEKVSRILKCKKQQLSKYDQLIKSRFVEMFDGKGLPVLKWNDVFNTTTGKLDSNAMVDGGQFPFFTCAKEVFAIDKYAFDQEALLLAGNNAAGKYDVKYYKGKFNAYQRTYVLDLKQSWSYQLFKYQLEDKLEWLREQSKGTNTRYITLKILGDLEFIIPQLEKQIEFEDFCNHVDKLKFVVQKSLNESQILYDSLMQKYFG